MRLKLGSRRVPVSIAVLGALLATPLAVVTGAAPAQAADTFQCATAAPVFGTPGSGAIRRYSYTGVGTTSVAGNSGTDYGSGWGAFPRILGGHDGRIYGINSSGLTRYRWTGSAFETVDGKQGWHITTSFNSYATPQFRNKITVDEIGDIYAVESSGDLRMWRFNEGTRTWDISGRLLDTGWQKYDLIVSGGPGVLYARTPAGALYRYRYEAGSQRWITYGTQVGSTGWQAFTKGIFSAGGDTLFAINAAGTLLHYRFREDTGTFVLSREEAGGSFAAFTNLVAVTSSCKLTERHLPVRPPTSVQSYSPVVATQGKAPTGAELGPLEYAYTDNIGRILHGYQGQLDSFNTIQWTTVNSPSEFTGKPSLIPNTTGDLQLLNRRTTTDYELFTRKAHPDTTFGAGSDIGGAMATPPVSVKLSDNSMVYFGLSTTGALWYRVPNTPTGGPLLPWRSLGGTGLTGELTVRAGLNGTATLFAFDADGTPITARYVARTVGAWTELGGAGFTGAVSSIVLPGPALRVFVRAANGQVMTQRSNSSGVFPGTWSPVGDMISTGTPAAMLDPASGRTIVVSRAPDEEIYFTVETSAGSGSFGPLKLINPDEYSDKSATDPTITEYRDSGGQNAVVLFRNLNGSVKAYGLADPVPGAARGARAEAVEHVFVEHDLPAPPK